MTEKKKRKHEEWGSVISDWRGSGLSVAKYCRSAGIPAWKFRYWSRKLSSHEAGARKGGFREMTFAQGDIAVAGFVVELPSGVRVRLQGGFSSDDLKRLLSVLGGAASC